MLIPKTIPQTLKKKFLMLLNRSFWAQASKLFITRFKMAVYPILKRISRHCCIVKVLGLPLLLIYIVFCVVELVLSLLYYAFPCFSCFFIFIKAYAKLTREVVTERMNINQKLSLIPTVAVIGIFMYSWYMYCVIFFDSIWFLIKIVTFTYTGVIAYPRISYGYLIIVFMTLYYISESFNSFKKNYQNLLSVSIKACKKVYEDLESNQAVTYLYENGIKVDLWNFIIERHRPKRIQVAYTLFQLFVIISILIVSLELLFKFDKFRDLSLMVHVFTALFICALPKIIQSMCIAVRGKRRREKKLLLEIKETITEYLNEEAETDQNSAFQFTN